MPTAMSRHLPKVNYVGSGDWHAFVGRIKAHATPLLCEFEQHHQVTT